MKTTTQDWLNFAKADLMNCQLILNEGFLTNIVAFHSQQAVEKSFKAWIEQKGINIPRVHNLQRLHDIIEQFTDINIDTNELVLLDSVYTSSRYPGELGLLSSGKPSLKEANNIFQIAKSIYEKIVQILDVYLNVLAFPRFKVLHMLEGGSAKKRKAPPPRSAFFCAILPYILQSLPLILLHSEVLRCNRCSQLALPILHLSKMRTLFEQ